MNSSSRRSPRPFVRGGIAFLALALLTGAAWHGLSANTPVADAPQIRQSALASPVVEGGRTSYADVVKVVAPAVVTIQVEGRAAPAPTAFQGEDFFRRFFDDRFGEGPQPPRMFRRRGLGSGVVASADGYILTNHHVVEGATTVRAEFADGRVLEARLVGSDPPSDLALLKVEASGLPAIAFGDSDVVQVGDVVLAVGNPLGVGQTVTMGIVSAKGRSTSVGDGSYEDFLQTDAPINQGNSGGALVNLRGELVGINSQILSPSMGNIGIGFAIPANMVRHVMTELRDTGRVRRAQLGVTVQPVTADMAASLGLTQAGGAIVSNVSPGSAAEHAGVRRGDIIRSLNGQAVTDTNALRNRVAALAPGSTATLVLTRDGAERSLTVTLDEAAASRQARGGSGQQGDTGATLGVAVAPVTPALASRAGLPGDVRGLLVQSVDPDGRAAAAGIQAGDVIVEVNRAPVTTVEELRAAITSAAANRPILLLVSRDGQHSYATAR
jgi:Do/DeqQ family serine protease